MIQGSQEWISARLGKATASRVDDATARTKTGWGASRDNYAAELVIERLTGLPADTWVSDAMRNGMEREPEARSNYEFYRGVEVEQIGFIDHPRIAMSGASPDGLLGKEGLLEIKCPTTATHIKTLLGEPIAGKYLKQMAWQMAVTGRQWCDWVSYCPLLPEEMRLYIQRVPRNDKLVAELERDVQDFLAEVDAKTKALTERYLAKAAA
jgi:predicted phage-related endonuclease